MRTEKTGPQERRQHIVALYLDAAGKRGVKQAEVFKTVALMTDYQVRENLRILLDEDKPFTAGGVPTDRYDMSDEQAAEFRNEGRRRAR